MSSHTDIQVRVELTVSELASVAGGMLTWAARPKGNASGAAIQNINPLFQQPIGFGKRLSDLSLCPRGLGRIGNAPMIRHWVAGPNGASFTRRVVANGKDEIEFRCLWLGKFLPRL